MHDFSWAALLGGLAFFFFGLHAIRQGLQLVAGDRLRSLLLHLTNNRFVAFSFGAFVTMVSQSSSATTAMLVSFAGAGLLTLTQSFGVILGADVGTTLVVFLLAAKGIADVALYFVALGFALYLWMEKPFWRYIGQVFYGFGLIFYGISMMVDAMHPLQDSQMTEMIFTALTGAPFWLMIGAAIFAALVQSSAATLGLAISLAFSGVINLDGALPLVLGANIGTTIAAVLAGLSSDLNAKRVAAAHVLTKFVGALIFFPLMGFAADGLRMLTASIPWIEGPFSNELGLQIALAHLGFNLGLAVIFLPFLPLGVRFIKYAFPERKGVMDQYKPRYLDKNTLQTPSLAFAQVHREVVRLGNMTYELFCQALTMFKKDVDFYMLEKEVEQQDDRIDKIEKAVRFFLAELSQEMLTSNQSRTQGALLGIAADFEEIGDAISKELRSLAHKKHERRGVFSSEGWAELKNFHDQVDEMFNMTIGCLMTRDDNMLKKIEAQNASLQGMQTESRMAHLQRLNAGKKESVETSSIHLDLLAIFSRISNKLVHISRHATTN